MTNNAPRPQTRNIGDYLKELDKLNKGDARIKAALRDIKDLHRNPLIHPEHNLTNDQALALLGSVQGAIISMLDEIKAAKLSAIAAVATAFGAGTDATAAGTP